MQRLEVSCAVRCIFTSLGTKWLTVFSIGDGVRFLRGAKLIYLDNLNFFLKY